MAEQLTVELRESKGKRNTRRLRKAGSVPAILYGHGEENLSLSVPADQLDLLIHHGVRIVTLAGAVNQSAFIRDVQWDVWGTHALHVDFTRVRADETVKVEVAIELRGEAPGVKEGGVVEQLVHEVAIECPAAAIPEKIVVNVNDLALGGSIVQSALELPRGATAEGNPDDVIVQCVEPQEVPEEEEAAAVEGEPEVIGGKKEEEEQEG